MNTNEATTFQHREKLLKEQYMTECHLCPRECAVDRTAGERGFCGSPADIMAGRAALHMWEEPCISGKEGSGAVFFSGCNLGCIYCQNHEISDGQQGLKITVEELARIFLRLQNEQRANNINLVTACHYVPLVAEALRIAKNDGLTVPVVYNSSGYEKVETLMLLAGLVDVYLPDLKCLDAEMAKQYSFAADYPEIAKAAIKEMFRQTGPVIFDDRGMVQQGVIVRQLLLPGHVKNSKAVLSWLHEEFGEDIYISIMSQYTPILSIPEVKEDKLLSRRVTVREYERLIDHATEIGIENGFIQEREVAKESFIPAFDGEGINI